MAFSTSLQVFVLVYGCIFAFAVLKVEAPFVFNFLNLNLREKNHSVIDKELNSQVPDVSFSDSTDPTPECPKDIRLAWQRMPPFIDKKSSRNSSEVKGVFTDILNHAFRICCHPCEANVKYSDEQNTTSSLHAQLFSKKAEAILPVHSDDQELYGGGLPYVQVLTSPGLMLIMNQEDFQKDGRLKVWNALAGTWTVLVPSILLVIIAGICIWALEFHANQGEFPKEFLSGASNGIWWSFVSMTTVGYGDKSPRTFFGRFFGMVWILFGLVICSFMVATLESALTVTSMDKKIEIFGKDIAVLERTEAYIEAVHQGARVKVFPSFHGAYTSLINNQVFGILEEIPFGIDHLNSIKDSRLVISRLYMRDISYGLALDMFFPLPATTCLRRLFKYRTKDISEILEHYYYNVMDVRRSAVVHGEEDEAVIPLLDVRSPFYMLLLYVLMICLGILLVGGLIHQFMASSRQCRRAQPDQDERKVSSVVPLRNFALDVIEEKKF
ncbi:uncharacterized protein LOC116303543 [Actinia tenebrosa]|uniref:Uncharacterized protein LOC116303543 n=1 Tax=Actinia tenebrosa TaxID=6105 RepID=A0A6P8IPZ7_ACTTE|nr:uncharacterized protein LOC116303543 [Actinia tenebrosa]